MRAVSFSVLLAASTAYAAVYTIGVGKDEVTGSVEAQLGFDPTRIVISTDPAAEIVFQMLAGTHQVYQTSFDAPCTPLSGGFSTDTVTRPAGEDASAASPTFSFTPSDVSSVLYFSDLAGTNCQRGAVFCVNTDEASSQSCNAFRIAAEALAGPDVSSGLPVQSSATSAATSAASSATSAASSVASSASSAVSSVASAVSSGANPSASASASGSAAPAQSSAPVSGATSQVKVASAVVGAMVAAVVGAVVVV